MNRQKTHKPGEAEVLQQNPKLIWKPSLPCVSSEGARNALRGDPREVRSARRMSNTAIASDVEKGGASLN